MSSPESSGDEDCIALSGKFVWMVDICMLMIFLSVNAVTETETVEFSKHKNLEVGCLIYLFYTVYDRWGSIGRVFTNLPANVNKSNAYKR